MKKERPIVISILAVIMVLVGIMDIILGFQFGADIWVIGYGVIAIVLSLGLWFLWPWAWVGLILMQIFAVSYAIYDWAANGEIDFLAIFFGIFIILYMLRKEIRVVFFPAKNIPTF